MALIELRQLSMRDAEEAITEIWTCLEEHDLATPQFEFEFHRDTIVSLSFRVDTDFSRVVELRLANWRAIRESPASVRAQALLAH